MNTTHISCDRVIAKLDNYLGHNDYESAVKHLKYWYDEAEQNGDIRSLLVLSNESIGLHRKMAHKNEAYFYTEKALEYLNQLDMQDSVTGATTFINTATAYKAFGDSEKALPLFEKAKSIYEANLKDDDGRLGGLYNNMALALMDLKQYKKAYESFDKALAVMKNVPNGELEQAITYLNMANAYEGELGLEDACEQIAACVDKAWDLLDTHKDSVDGYYAFVCEKCAPTFGYYGYFADEENLSERAKRIYERA